MGIAAGRMDDIIRLQKFCRMAPVRCGYLLRLGYRLWLAQQTFVVFSAATLTSRSGVLLPGRSGVCLTPPFPECVSHAGTTPTKKGTVPSASFPYTSIIHFLVHVAPCRSTASQLPAGFLAELYLSGRCPGGCTGQPRYSLVKF